MTRVFLRPLIAVIQRSGGILIGLFTAAICVIAAIAAQELGLHLWADFMTGLNSATTLLFPVVAGFMAFSGGRSVSALQARLRVSPHPEVLVHLHHFGAVITPVLLGYGIGMGTLVLYGQFIGAYGTPPVMWILELAAALICVAGLGYALGILIGNRWWIAPATALALFAGFAAIIYSARAPEWVELWYPMTIDSGSVFIDPVARTLGVQAIAYVCFGLAFVGLAAALKSSVKTIRRYIPGACSALIGTVMFSMVMLGEWPFAQVSKDFDYVCTGEEPEICLNRGYLDAEPELRDSFEAFNEKVAGTSLVAHAVEQRFIGLIDETVGESRAVDVIDLSPGFADYAVLDYLQNYGGSMNCWDKGRDETAVSVVDAWLSGYDENGLSEYGDEIPEASAYRQLLKLSPQQGNEWLRENINAYSSCALNLKDLP